MATTTYQAIRALNELDAKRREDQLNGISDTARLPALLPMPEEPDQTDQLPAFLRRQAD